MRTGEAYFFTEGYHTPRKIRALGPNQSRSLEPPEDDELVASIQSRSWYRVSTRQRVEAELSQLGRAMDEFDLERMAVIRRACELVGKAPLLMAKHNPGQTAAWGSLASNARILRDGLCDLHREFSRGPMRRLLPLQEHCDLCDGAAAWRAELVKRFEEVIEPDTSQCLRILDDLIRKCRTLQP